MVVSPKSDVQGVYRGLQNKTLKLSMVYFTVPIPDLAMSVQMGVKTDYNCCTACGGTTDQGDVSCSHLSLCYAHGYRSFRR
jgi:hypothetical protein